MPGLNSLFGAIIRTPRCRAVFRAEFPVCRSSAFAAGAVAQHGRRRAVLPARHGPRVSPFIQGRARFAAAAGTRQAVKNL